jgi:hypothetical protein
MKNVENILKTLSLIILGLIITPFYFVWILVSTILSGIWTLIAGFFVIALCGGTIEQSLAGASIASIFVTVIAKLISERNKK